MWNLYEFLEANPVLHGDPMGLRTSAEGQADAAGCIARCGRSPWRSRCREKCVECARSFQRWIDNQRRNGDGWMGALPDCPCSIVHEIRRGVTNCGGVFAYYTELVWYMPRGWHDDPADTWEFFVWLGTGVWDFHPGSHSCIRSDEAENGAVQQCCYDHRGKLITSGSGAGTPDRNDPTHPSSDVDPIVCAMHLDGGGFDGGHVRIYESFRPPNNGNNCDPNHVGGR